MIQIKYIGSHRPNGMIVDVDENVAKDAIKTGEWIIPSTSIPITLDVEKEEEKKPEKIKKKGYI